MRLVIQHGSRLLAELRVLEPEYAGEAAPDYDPRSTLSAHLERAEDSRDWAGFGFTRAAT